MAEAVVDKVVALNIGELMQREQDMKADMDEIIKHMVARRAMLDLKELAEESGWNVTNLQAIFDQINKHGMTALELMMKYHNKYHENPPEKINLADLGKE